MAVIFPANIERKYCYITDKTGELGERVLLVFCVTKTDERVKWASVVSSRECEVSGVSLATQRAYLAPPLSALMPAHGEYKALIGSTRQNGSTLTIIHEIAGHRVRFMGVLIEKIN